MKFNPISASDLLAWEPGPIKWIWDRFIPAGSLFLLAGFMKSGKSTFAYPLAVSVAQGIPFLGHSTRQEGVLILSVEENWIDVRARLKLFGVRSHDPLFVHCGAVNYKPSEIGILESFVLQNKIALILVDTLSLFISNSLVDENNNSELVRNISPLLDLARSTNCAIGLIHHTSKAGGEGGRGIRGASALFGIVDQALLLEKPQGRNSNQRVLKVLGRYSESPPESIIELRGAEWHCLGSSAEAIKQESITHIRKILSDATEARTVEQVANRTVLSPKAVRQVLDELNASGEVIREGKGVKGDPFMYRSNG